MIISETERAINDILGILPTETSVAERRRGRPSKNQSVWSLNFYEPEKNTTYAVISMCIKEDTCQTFDELCKRVAKAKNRPVSECKRILSQLRECGKLGYYDDYSLRFRTWKGDF